MMKYGTVRGGLTPEVRHGGTRRDHKSAGVPAVACTVLVSPCFYRLEQSQRVDEGQASPSARVKPANQLCNLECAPMWNANRQPTVERASGMAASRKCQRDLPYSDSPSSRPNRHHPASTEYLEKNGRIAPRA